MAISKDYYLLRVTVVDAHALRLMNLVYGNSRTPAIEVTALKELFRR